MLQQKVIPVLKTTVRVEKTTERKPRIRLTLPVAVMADPTMSGDLCSWDLEERKYRFEVTELGKAVRQTVERTANLGFVDVENGNVLVLDPPMGRWEGLPNLMRVLSEELGEFDLECPSPRLPQELSQYMSVR